MSEQTPSERNPTGLTSAGDLARRVEGLRAHMTSQEPDSSVEHVLVDVCDAVERMSVEHGGMAQELVSVYEQLGVVFDVTRRLPHVQSESEVIDLFVDSLARSSEGRTVFSVLPAEPSSEAGAPSSDWLAAMVQRVGKSGNVQVEQPPEGALTDDIVEVMIGPVYAGGSFVCAIVFTSPRSAEAFRASDMMLLESLTMFCGDLIRNHRLVHELREMSVAMVRSLVNAVDQKDPYTSGHSLRVGYFATLLGARLGLDADDRQMLQWSALLHDVGKIGIRDDVLKKEGKLTTEEFDHMKEHPVRSHQVVKGIPQLTEALDGVLHHHEHYDGSGYPSSLAGEDIPLQARIIQIADIFDALTSNRSYRPAYDWRKALDILDREAGTTVDPGIAQIFSEIIHEALDQDPDGWDRLIRTANKFAHDASNGTGLLAGAH